MSRAISHIDTFQGLILALQNYWAEQGCVILQPYDMEMGAGTFHTATFLRALGPETWNVLRSAVTSPERWSLWRKSKPFATLLPVPSGA